MHFKTQELATGLNGEKGCLLAIKCDVSKEDDVISLMTRVREEFGGVDVCINNAGLAHSEPLLSGNTEQWRHMMEVSDHVMQINVACDHVMVIVLVLIINYLYYCIWWLPYS